MTHLSEDQIERARKCIDEALKILSEIPALKREPVKKDVWCWYNPDHNVFQGLSFYNSNNHGGTPPLGCILLHGVLKEDEG